MRQDSLTVVQNDASRSVFGTYAHLQKQTNIHNRPNAIRWKIEKISSVFFFVLAHKKKKGQSANRSSRRSDSNIEAIGPKVETKLNRN